MGTPLLLCVLIKEMNEQPQLFPVMCLETGAVDPFHLLILCMCLCTCNNSCLVARLNGIKLNALADNLLLVVVGSSVIRE